jgi:hypothetical protein
MIKEVDLVVLQAASWAPQREDGVEKQRSTIENEMKLARWPTLSLME